MNLISGVKPGLLEAELQRRDPKHNHFRGGRREIFDKMRLDWRAELGQGVLMQPLQALRIR
jgi:hypothetical protein